MKKPTKRKALKLIDEKINQFKDLIKEEIIDNKLQKRNLYDSDYLTVYEGAILLLTDLFSSEDAQSFALKAQIWDSPGETAAYKQLLSYKNHIENCISLLGVYKEKIHNFWTDEKERKLIDALPHNEVRSIFKRAIPFVSMSFKESDKAINNYITGILDALQIDFNTGERYSKDSVSEKVKKRIKNSSLFIGIFVKRDKIEGGGYRTSDWLIKELGIAQGSSKDVIALIEKEVGNIANLRDENELIYFERDNLKAIQGATMKFLEALKEHKLV